MKPAEYLPVGPLQPGTYVVELDSDRGEDIEAIAAYLREHTPEGVHFIVLGARVRMVRTGEYRAVVDKASDRTSV